MEFFFQQILHVCWSVCLKATFLLAFRSLRTVFCCVDGIQIAHKTSLEREFFFSTADFSRFSHLAKMWRVHKNEPRN